MLPKSMQLFFCPQGFWRGRKGRRRNRMRRVRTLQWLCAEVILQQREEWAIQWLPEHLQKYVLHARNRIAQERRLRKIAPKGGTTCCIATLYRKDGSIRSFCNTNLMDMTKCPFIWISTRVKVRPFWKCPTCYTQDALRNSEANEGYVWYP